MTIEIRGAGPYTVQAVGRIFCRTATLEEAIAEIQDCFDIHRASMAQFHGWSGERWAAEWKRRIVRRDGRTVARVTPSPEGPHTVELLDPPARRTRQSRAKNPLGHLVGETRTRLTLSRPRV